MGTEIVKSKKVKIMRKEILSLYQLENSKKDVTYIPNTGHWRIGSSINTKNPPLTVDEEKLYLPNLISVASNDTHFLAKKQEYWDNISVSIPEDGLELEIGFQYVDENDKVGSPINVADYVFYRYCLVYSRVANTSAERMKSDKIRFYIYDANIEAAAQMSKINLDDKAMDLYLSIIKGSSAENKLRIDNILLSFDTDINGMSDTNKHLTLRNYASKESAKFVEIAGDKLLEMKGIILTAVYKRVLDRQPLTETIMYGVEILGNNLKEAAAKLMLPQYEKTLNEIKNKIGYLPPVPTVVTDVKTPPVKEQTSAKTA